MLVGLDWPRKGIARPGLTEKGARYASRVGLAEKGARHAIRPGLTEKGARHAGRLGLAEKGSCRTSELGLAKKIGSLRKKGWTRREDGLVKKVDKVAPD